MLILMTNPNHGSMYVYSEGDAVRHESLGWVRAAPEVATSRIPAEALQTIPESIRLDDLVQLPPTITVRNKPGPKPKAK